MNKLFILTMLGISFSLSAQGTIVVDAEDLPIEEKPTLSVSATPNNPSVVILNNQKSNQVQKSKQANSQPTVQVLGQPVSETYAVELKKSRYEAELQTEQKIVEKLESSRLRDEQERLNKLFGKASATTVTASMSSSPVVSTTTSNAHAPSESPKIAYIGFHGGQSSNFTALKNVHSYGSLGVSFGAFGKRGLMVKSDFFYSKHRIKNMHSIYSNYSYDEYNKTMSHQISGLLTLGYTPSYGRFRPYAGGSIAYSHWMHSATTDDSKCRSVSLRDCKNQVRTDSIDLGLTAGVDFQLNQRLSIGFNMLVNAYNIYNNLSDRIADYDDYERNDENPVYIEETNWLIASINAKLYF